MLTSHLNVHPNLVLVTDHVKYFSFPHFPVLVNKLCARYTLLRDYIDSQDCY